MDNIWNHKCLKSPPIYTLKCQRPLEGLGELLLICKNLENSLKVVDIFKTEVAVLSRMIYKTKNKLRFDKGFQNAKKVRRCVQRYLDLNAVDCVKYFSSCLPTVRTDLYMPSRQMLQYLLVRLMGIARLLHQAVLYCKTTGTFLVKRVCLGQSWNLATLLLAIISRIWSVCQSHVLPICKAYCDLHAFVPHLIASEAAWLPENFILPKDLSAWLGLDKTPKSANLAQETLLSDKIFNLITEEDEESSEEVLLTDDVLSTSPPTSSKAVQDNHHLASNMEAEDLGESIKSSMDTVGKAEDKSKNFMGQKISAIKNLGDLVKFVNQEFLGTKHKNTRLHSYLKNLIKTLQKNEKLNNSKKNAKLIKKAKTQLFKEMINE